MPAPLAKGVIIAASILVAAGIAIYESPQVRQWVDQSRRKIAIALHSLGDEIQPRRRSSEASEDFEERKRRREEIIRRNRNELIRRAREEGVAVDLDELARIGQEVELMEQRSNESRRHRSGSSFDDLVGTDGMLKKDSVAATGTDLGDKSTRRRGFPAGAAASNPFTDEHQVLFDHEDHRDGAPEPETVTHVEEPATQTRESSATFAGDAPLIDLSPQPPSTASLTPEDPQTASIPQSEADDIEAAAQSFYSFTSTSSHAHIEHDAGSDLDNISAGTLTPRSERSGFTGASVVGSQADDIAIMSMHSDDDARSEAFSEAGFTEGGFSEVGSERHLGVMTPSSWTDVGSDDESEFGGVAQGSQLHQ